MRIYLDNAATTKVDSKVAKKVQEFFTDKYGNASSLHSIGSEVREELKKAREKIVEFVGCDASEIIFTSSGTESNNLALRGLAKANPDKKHIITSVIEHPSILETCKDLEKSGYKVDYVGVNSEGIVNVEQIKEKISENTLVVSVMHVNNEIGTIQPVEEIGTICKNVGVYFHTDAVQGFTKVDLSLGTPKGVPSQIQWKDKLGQTLPPAQMASADADKVGNIDLFSVSGHKFHAPKGIGFLYVKKGTDISAIITGGGQENGLRSGTENVPGIVGLATALEVDNNKNKIKKSRDKIIKELLKIPGARINGSMNNRVYHNINVSFYGVEGESLMLMLDKDGICVSTGSACASSKLKESYVLKAIGVEDLYIHGSLRLTLGSDAIGNEDYIVEKIKKSVEKLREISPFKFEENSKEVIHEK